jgi:hypothetical protein
MARARKRGKTQSRKPKGAKMNREQAIKAWMGAAGGIRIQMTRYKNFSLKILKQGGM